MAAELNAAIRRDIEVMTAQGETPERIAAHLRIDVADVKRATGKPRREQA